jgi:hypothetical protein
MHRTLIRSGVKSKTAPARVRRRTNFEVIPVAAVVRLAQVSKAGAPAHPGKPKKRKGPKPGSRSRS